ncbi:MAG: hypothetical protein IT430_10595 [Phycisphaerales bacterium]|nr:hypothetical protein [Phycisphaerales bacterium]
MPLKNLSLVAAGVIALAGATGTLAALPPCGPEGGNPFLAFALDGSRLLTWRGTPYPNYFVTMGLKNLDIPGFMLMESGGNLIASKDEGCSWSLVATLGIDQWPLNIAPTPGGGAYAFGVNRSTLYRVDYDGQDFSATPLRSPTGSILGLGADPFNPSHVRLSSDRGQIYDSIDGGVSWNPVGVTPPAGNLTYRMAFDPNDLDHALFGGATSGGWVTFDGGQNWTPCLGLSETNGPVNLFNAVISSVDSDYVWVMALDLDQADAGHPSGGRHFYLSTDGGVTFEPKVDNGPGVTITNGPEMTCHPTRKTALAWAWGSRFDGMYVYQYDAVLNRLKSAYKAGFIARTVEYYRPDPRHLYVGLEAR